MESGAAQYDFEQLDTAALITDVVERFRSELAVDGHPVELRVNGPVPDVRVDRTAFGLALRNLLDNAVKYSPATAPIHVELSTVDGRADGRVVVRVRDDGPGVPKSEQGAIFDKFVRGAAARTSGIRRSGVGLAVARQIIRAHGGDIGVNSEPGQGSTFSITLPAPRETK